MIKRFRWNTRLPQPGGAEEGAVREASRHMGLRGHPVHPPGRLSAFLGRGSASTVRADQDRIVRRRYLWAHLGSLTFFFQNPKTVHRIR